MNLLLTELDAGSDAKICVIFAGPNNECVEYEVRYPRRGRRTFEYYKEAEEYIEHETASSVRSTVKCYVIDNSLSIDSSEAKEAAVQKFYKLQKTLCIEAYNCLTYNGEPICEHVSFAVATKARNLWVAREIAKMFYGA